MRDEGSIKYQAHWRVAPPLPVAPFVDLLAWRERLYQLGLIGQYPNGVGYGNLSQRWSSSGQFLITGSGTGSIAPLGMEHFSLVTAVAVAQNQVWCEGPLVASSESMSHAVLYAHAQAIGAVFHVHHHQWWRDILFRVPTTPASVPYGTPAMAEAILTLLEESDLAQQHILAMAGHEDGIIVFGPTVAATGELLLAHFARWC